MRAKNGRELSPHDGVTEWSVCGSCGELIDWAADWAAERAKDDLSCPHCGHDDTAYLYAAAMAALRGG